MSNIANIMGMAASYRLTGGSYLVTGRNYSGASGSTPSVFLLDHTTPGTLSIAGSASLVYTTGPTYSLDWSPDGNYVIQGADTSARLYSASGGSISLSSTYSAPGEKLRASFYQDGGNGDWIAVGQENSNRFTILDHQVPGTIAFERAPSMTRTGTATAWSPDGNWIGFGRASTDNNQFFYLYDARTNPSNPSNIDTYGETASTFNNVNAISFTPDGAYIAIAHQNGDGLTLLSNSSGTLSKATSYNMATPYDVDFRKDGKYLVAATGGTGYIFSHTAGSLSLASTISGAGTYCCYMGGDYIAFTNNSGVSLYNVSDPTNPTLSTTLTVDNNNLSFIAASPN